MIKQAKMISLLVCLGAISMNTRAADSFDQSAISHWVDVNASLSDVWHAWTSDEGAQTFFARGSNVNARPDGDYEIFFFPDNEPGNRGAEGTTTLIVEPLKRFAFTWDAPPKWPTIRSQRTVVEVFFESLSENKTRVSLHHSLWGDSKEWNEVREYFAGAWPVVLKRLKWRFDHGPVNWDNPAPGLIYRDSPN